MKCDFFHIFSRDEPVISPRVSKSVSLRGWGLDLSGNRPGTHYVASEGEGESELYQTIQKIVREELLKAKRDKLL